MDQHLSAVIIAAMTGVFSLISLYIQRRQDKIIHKIDEQTGFIEKEKLMKQKLTNAIKDREEILDEIIILILDVSIAQLNSIESRDKEASDALTEKAQTMKNRLLDKSESISRLNVEYELVTNFAEDFQKELQKLKENK